jgi:hypothetical protein
VPLVAPNVFTQRYNETQVVVDRLVVCCNGRTFLDTLLNFIETCMISAEEAANRKRVKRALVIHVCYHCCVC